MSVFVLVHGGFYGGWGFTQVARLLRAAGHEVYSPTLTGSGERAHLASPEVGLSINIQDVIGVLQCEDLHEVILIGHSYGTWVITGVAEREFARISRLVYLDGMIPKDGQTVIDDGVAPELSMEWRNYTKEKGDGWRLPNPPFPPPRWQPFLLKQATEPIKITNPDALKIPRAFIHCTVRDKSSSLYSSWLLIDRSAEEARQNRWWYRDIPEPHAVMMTNPKLLADTLLELG